MYCIFTAFAVPGTYATSNSSIVALSSVLGSTPDSVPFTHTASLLRVSSLSQLDIPVVHQLARAHLEGMYPSGPEPFVHPGHLEEALALAVQYKITPVRTYQS